MAFSPGPRAKAAALFGCGLAIAVLAGWLMAPVILPLLLSSALYILLEPLVSLLQRRGMSRVTAIGVVLAGLLGLAGWLAAVALPVLSEQLRLLGEQLPGAWENLSQRIGQTELWFTASLGLSPAGSPLMDRLGGLLDGWTDRAVGLLTAWISRVALWVVLVPLISFFLLRDYRSLRNMLIGATPNRHFETALSIYHRVAHQLETYIRGVLIQSGVMALMTGTGFFIIGLPMAPVLGIIAGVLNVIPYVGPMLSLAAPAMVALTTGAGADVYAGLLLVVLVAQLADNLFVIPTVVARAADIHPLMALLGVIVAGNLFGLMGMVFAIPVLSSGRIIYSGLLAGVERRVRT